MTDKKLLKGKAYIDFARCVGCGACIENCPTHAIFMQLGWISSVDQEKCSACGNCVQICHKSAPYIIV
ncbi:4Fe-4S binding protein [Clostridium sp. MF28]|uniref:4Fe-4S binding protein n=1 Tax=Clostridium sp. MF28 TaxID=1702238 RepID=UPI001FA88C96|nr:MULTISPECIES: 4Fe-4S binding protein [Clostridium]